MRYGRQIAYGVAGLFALFLILVFAGLQALKSNAGRARISAALAAKLGEPVAIGGLDVLMFPPSVAGSDIAVGGRDATAAPGVALTGFWVRPRLSSLLPGRTVAIDDIALEGLRISIRRDSRGHWLLPGAAAAPAAATSAAPGGPALEVGALRLRHGAIRVVDDSLRTGDTATITEITDIEADLEATGGALNVRRFTGRLGTTSVTGSADLGRGGAHLNLVCHSLNSADLPRLFALAGIPPYPGLAIEGAAPVELRTRVAPDFKTFAATGRASVERVRLGVLTLDSLRSPFRFDHGVFSLDTLAFGLYGGSQQGNVQLDLSRGVPTYTINTSVTGLDVNRALTAALAMPNVLLGTVAMSGQITGSGSTAEAIQQGLGGQLTLELRDGVLRNYPLLSQVNHVVGVTGGTGSDTRFESISATANIGEGRARIPDLLLKAGNLNVTGAGVVTFDRTVDFRLRADLKSPVGHVQVPVLVSGSVTAPSTKVQVGEFAKQKMRGIGSGLKKLFGK
jgi:uncharacterized protein involved in outer membrane biogenesis